MDMVKRPYGSLIFLWILLCLSLPATAQEEARQQMTKMKAALEPSRSSVRRIEITLDEPGEQTTQWKAWQAVKRSAAGDKTVLVVVDPPDVRGTAHLIHDLEQGGYAQWLYLPFARRVRRILVEDAYQPFLGSDFTLIDLGLVQLGERSFKLLGKQQLNGTEVYEIEEIPANRMYYSRIVNWVAVDSMLPLRREYYTPAGLLWKVQTYEDITKIDGVPSPRVIEMENVRSGSTTRLRVTALEYRADLPEELFDPKALPQLSKHPYLSSDQPAAEQ